MFFDVLYGFSNVLLISLISIFYQILFFRFDILVDVVVFVMDEEINYFSEVLGSVVGLGVDMDEVIFLVVEVEDR